MPFRFGVLWLTRPIAAAVVVLSCLAAPAAVVDVIVNPALYAGGSITAGLNQYLVDLQIQGHQPNLVTTAFADAAALRGHLASRWQTGQLAGAVLIGDLPNARFERWGQFGKPTDHQIFPCDLYFMDLNGTWTDADATHNGVFDAHSGNVSPEIWVGRILTSKLTSLHPGRTEAGLMNDYFAKNHAYRQGLLTLPANGLAYIDDDWASWANAWANDLNRSLPGTVDRISTSTTTTAADYKDRLGEGTSPGYESVLVAAHSSATLHSFKPSAGNVRNSELEALDPQAFFYNLFACSNANYEATGYMGGEYVFGTDLGLAAVGSTKTGAMLNFTSFYQPLGAGANYGEAFLSWFQAIASGGFTSTEMDWHYGMTLLGDPLLTTQAHMPVYVPEPSTAALLLLCLACLGILRRRGRAA